MPLKIPTLDDRKYQELLDEALARIPVHNPEWTNFNKSDPGVTLVELFAFLTENLLYRSNQIPERNRRKFLTLLGVPLQSSASARGIVTFANERGPLRTLTFTEGLEVQAGQVPFRTEQGLDVLPIDAYVVYKRKLDRPSEQLLDYYRQLYASYRKPFPRAEDLELYETVPFSTRVTTGIELGRDTVDGSLWIALLVREADKPFAEKIQEARDALANRTLNVGVVPFLDEAGQRMGPGRFARPTDGTLLRYRIPQGGVLPADPASRRPEYTTLPAVAGTDVLTEPGIVQITLPPADKMRLWEGLEPLEAGVGDFPPSLEDTDFNERVITWLRISTPATVKAKLRWVGINAVMVAQRARVTNEPLPAGNGEPDQLVVLAQKPVVPHSVRLTVTPPNGKPEVWTEIEDLFSAGPEVPVPDPRLPPGAPPPPNLKVKVFTVNPEAGEIRFGDGAHGARPPRDAILQCSYDHGLGRDGNVGVDAISSGPALPAGVKVRNPLPTWGGTDAETVAEGEKQIPRYLQHRDRPVNAADFEAITLRTPGVDVGRVEVLAAFNPDLDQDEPGDAPGAVTLMVIPRYDPAHPNAPVPDQLFLNAICRHLDERRLVTTEIFLRRPVYKPIWLSVGVTAAAELGIAPVVEAVRRALLDFLSPLPAVPQQEAPELVPLLTPPRPVGMSRGWPLRKPVVALELLSVASRVTGVLLVRGALLAEGNQPPQPTIPMRGLELPEVVGISVVAGEPVDLEELRGLGPAAGQVPPEGGITFLPVPVMPEEC